MSPRYPNPPFALLAALIGALWLSAAVAATPTVNPKPDQQKLPSKVTFTDAPSSEKPEARKKRLKRECKGRPNAGMCLGHTR